MSRLSGQVKPTLLALACVGLLAAPAVRAQQAEAETDKVIVTRSWCESEIPTENDEERGISAMRCLLEKEKDCLDAGTPPSACAVAYLKPRGIDTKKARSGGLEIKVPILRIDRESYTATIAEITPEGIRPVVLEAAPFYARSLENGCEYEMSGLLGRTDNKVRAKLIPAHLWRLDMKSRQFFEVENRKALKNLKACPEGF